MLSLEIYKKIPIVKRENDLYTSFSCVNDNYYFCDPNRYQIVQYNHCFEYVKSIKVKRRYTKICYYPKDKCYYALAYGSRHHIYILNASFEEIDCIPVPLNYGCSLSAIDCYRGFLYLSTQNQLYKMATNYCQDIEKYLETENSITALGIFPDYTITANQEYKSEMINVYCKNKKHLLSVCLPCGYCIQDIKQCHHKVYILVSNHCEYNSILICHIQCHHHTDNNSCNDVIESIALIEASLSHILNAEGEKLQKIIQSTSDPNIILDVNEAVNKTIVNITHLEHVLYSKLEAAKAICDQKNNDK